MPKGPKRVGIPENVQLPAVELYLDDLRAIDGVLQQSTHRAKYKAQGYEYSSLRQLVDHASSPLDALTINAFGRVAIFFVVDEDIVHLYLSDRDDLIGRGAFERIKGILESRIVVPTVSESQPSTIHLSPKLSDPPVTAVNLMTPADTRGLWERNKDQLFVLAVGAVLGTVLGAVSTLLLQAVTG